MASAWGNSWGVSWGNSWGSIAAESQRQEYGSGGYRKKKRLTKEDDEALVRFITEFYDGLSAKPDKPAQVAPLVAAEPIAEARQQTKPDHSALARLVEAAELAGIKANVARLEKALEHYWQDELRRIAEEEDDEAAIEMLLLA